MRLSSLLCAFALGAAACTPDSGLTLHDNNRPPVVALLAPAAGEHFIEGEDIEFRAHVEDDVTGLDDLELIWRSTNGGALTGAQSVVDGAITLLADALPPGEHTVSLTALDEQGASGRADVTLVVEDNRAPVVGYLQPNPGGQYPLGSDVLVVASVVDDWDPPEEVVLAWSDDAAGVADLPLAPDDGDEASFSLSGLAEGPHRVTITASDVLGATRTVSVDFTVVDPDQDGDGHVAMRFGGDDCDDGAVVTHPGADEICDGEDNDCNGVDDDDPTDGTPWYYDDDLDGWGDLDVSQDACTAPGPKWKAQGGDCDDADNNRFPTNPEVCDGVDNDCAGGPDNGLTFTTYYFDDDLDGWGDPNLSQGACADPGGKWKTQGGDCDDTTNTRFPTNPEVCDGIDNDCQNGPDDGLTFATWYTDTDGDTWGLIGSGVSACAEPPDSASRGGDCDDDNGLVNPGRAEVCDGVDNDCTGGPDDGLSFVTYYWDDDLDGWGDSGTSESACADPGSKWKTQGGDCDDADNNRFPTNPEVCDGVDNDCVSGIDNGLTFTTWYTDDDDDTWGLIGSGVSACSQPAGTVDRGGDCDDVLGTINPGAAEVCDGVDNDCAGGPDDGLSFVTWYYDWDLDGYGIVDTTVSDCDTPAGRWAALDGDCDDDDDLVNPGEAEVCNGTDDDCFGGIDDGLTFLDYYYDDDLDGYGDPDVSQSACADPGGKWKTQGGDCDDTTNARFPTNTEVCDGLDNDCANGADDGLVFTTWYTDDDDDTWGLIGSGVSACAQPAGAVDRGGDCDDVLGTINPDASEVCDGVDNDCANGIDDGLTFDTWYYDFDLDGYGDPNVTQLACDTPTGRWVDAAGDCDDSDEYVNPLETEICNNGKDDDCVNGADDADPGLDLATATTWYYDEDGDDWGLAGTTTLACLEPASYAAVPGDCDDTEDLVNPGEIEVCDNGVDDDCANGIDDGCDVDHSGTWLLYEPGTDNRLDVAYGCDGWSFTFDTVLVTDTWPTIEVEAYSPSTIRVNGCEPGWEIFCTDPEAGMPGAYDASSTTDWTAWDSIEPLLGSGYAEIYEWRDTTGTAGTYVTFTDDSTFVGSFAWHFEPRSTSVPGSCQAGSIEVEGRKQ